MKSAGDRNFGESWEDREAWGGERLKAAPRGTPRTVHSGCLIPDYPGRTSAEVMWADFSGIAAPSPAGHLLGRLFRAQHTDLNVRGAAVTCKGQRRPRIPETHTHLPPARL